MRAGVKNNIKAALVDGKMTPIVIHYKPIKTHSHTELQTVCVWEWGGSEHWLCPFVRLNTSSTRRLAITFMYWQLATLESRFNRVKCLYSSVAGPWVQFRVQMASTFKGRALKRKGGGENLVQCVSKKASNQSRSSKEKQEKLQFELLQKTPDIHVILHQFESYSRYMCDLSRQKTARNQEFCMTAKRVPALVYEKQV